MVKPNITVTDSKPNITLVDIGGLYTTNGKDVWELEEFQPEPQVIMKCIGEERLMEGNLSEFVNFVRLLPEGKIPVPRKPRSDKGSHKPSKTKQVPPGLEVGPEIAQPAKRRKSKSGKPDLISTFTCKIPDDPSKPIVVSFGEYSASALTLTEAVTELMLAVGITKADVKAAPESEGKVNLLAILNQ